MTHNHSKQPAHFLLASLVVVGTWLGQARLLLGEVDGVVLIQQVLRLEVGPGDDNAVRLILENRGTKPVRVAKPPSASQFREYWWWHGFSLEISGPDGKSCRNPLPKIYPPNPPIHDEETAVLRPGESVGMLIPLSKITTNPVSDATGSYVVSACYDTSDCQIADDLRNRKGEPPLWDGKLKATAEYKVVADLPEKISERRPAANPPSRQIDVVVSGEVVPAVVKAGQPIPLKVRISNKLKGPVRFQTYSMQPVEWNGDTCCISLVDIYRDGKKFNLYLARPQIKVPKNISGSAAYKIAPGEMLEVSTDASKWKLRDGWLPGRYQLTVRADALLVDDYSRIHVLSDSFEFEVEKE
jgi:hypothetical protein